MTRVRTTGLLAFLLASMSLFAACSNDAENDATPTATSAGAPSSSSITTSLPAGVQAGVEAFIHDRGGVYIGECPGEWKPRGDTPEWCHARESDQGQRFEVSVGVAASDYVFNLVFEKDSAENWQLISSEQARNI